jgi:hypothetical protein
MFISGFTIIKNAIINDYPVVESITSILPVVDEMIVLVGDSDDDTRKLIESINDPKIRIYDSVWNKSLRTGGQALANETNKAFNLISTKADWAFYIQADEMVHEKYHAAILEGCKQYMDDKRVQGLLFKYLHFYGTYDYVGDSRKWYSREIRIIRNNKEISAYRDAQGFRIGSAKLPVKLIDAYIYHYGWVKNPAQMIHKQKHIGQYWVGQEDYVPPEFDPSDIFNFSEYDSIQKFEDSHPSVMKKRIREQNWHMELDPKKKNFSFKEWLLYSFEKLTGIRPFDFKNYKIIK